MNPNLRMAVLVTVGAIAGSVINALMAAAQTPVWLTKELTLGVNPPLTIDAIVAQFTLGFTFNVSFATIIGVVLAVWIALKLK